MIHIFTSTKAAPVLVESLADKKVKIGELVELSVACSHSSNIGQDHQYHLRQNVVEPYVAKVNDKMIKSESISEMISLLVNDRHLGSDQISLIGLFAFCMFGRDRHHHH